LYYFKSPNETQPQGKILLENSTFHALEDKGLENCFEAIVKQSNVNFKMYFAAESKAVMNEWLKELNGLIEDLKNPLGRVDLSGPDELIEKLFLDNFSLALAIASNTKIGEGDRLALVLINIFESKNLVLPFIKGVISREVDNTLSDGTLFRGTSLASKFLREYSRRVGANYLKETLKPILLEIIEEGNSMEVYPNKLSQGEDVAQNAVRLIDASQKILDRILASVDICPKELREICHHLRVQVLRKFPSLQLTGVGGFIFLRFFCPAIVNPTDILDPLEYEVPRNVLRNFVLIAKCLQYISNNLTFPEEHLQVLNPFIKKSIELVNEFFKDISQELEVPIDIKPREGQITVDPQDAKELEAHVITMLDKLESEFQRLKIVKSLNFS